MAEFQVNILLILASLVSIIVVKAILNGNQKKCRRAPSPPSLPLIGHFHLLPPLPHQAFHNLSTRYGPIMQLYLGSVSCVIASTPEAIKEFFKTHESSFSDRYTNFAINNMGFENKGIIFSAYGPYWRFMRKLCVSQLLGGHTLDILQSVRRTETMRFLRLLQKKGTAGEAVDVGDELLTLANTIVSRMTMGRMFCGDDDETREIRELVKATVGLIGKFDIRDFVGFLRNLKWNRLNRIRETGDRFAAIMEKVIKEHEEERRNRKKLGQGGQIRDLLDILLDIRDDQSSEIEMTTLSVKAFIMDLFMAGTDTSALTMEWALSELINHPHVMEKARQEIDSVVGKSRIVEESDIPNLPYLQAIVKESMRLHPTVPIVGRLSSESRNVWGYEIPEKTLVYANLWSLGRNPDVWENPLEFKPERFMSAEGGGKGHVDVRGQHFELLPFGSGRRLCPGASLAMHVIQTSLAAMVQCFEWKVEGGKQTVDMEERAALTLQRVEPLKCVPVPRLNPFPPISDLIQKA